MNPTHLIKVFQAERNAALAEVRLASLYLELLLLSFNRHCHRETHESCAYCFASRFVCRVRRRFGENVTPEDCTYFALHDWAQEQENWHAMKDGPVFLDIPHHQY